MEQTEHRRLECEQHCTNIYKLLLSQPTTRRISPKLSKESFFLNHSSIKPQIPENHEPFKIHLKYIACRTEGRVCKKCQRYITSHLLIHIRQQQSLTIVVNQLDAVYEEAVLIEYLNAVSEG